MVTFSLHFLSLLTFCSFAPFTALSTETKTEGTTNRLLAAAEAAVNARSYTEFLDRIEDTHMDVIYSMLKTHALREEVSVIWWRV